MTGLCLGVLMPERSADAVSGDELFGGARAAFCERIWFVRADLDLVARTVGGWHADISKGAGASTQTPLTASLESLLPRLEPWAMPSWRQLLVATDSEWTAVFSQGSDIYTASQVGKRLGRPSIRTSFSPHVVRDGSIVSHGDCAFWWYEDGREARTVQVSHQSRWEWHAYGEPLLFEDLERYCARKIVDRFDLPQLNSYCAALGIRRWDPDFYLPRAVLVEGDTSGWAQQPRTMSTAQWRAAHR